MTEGDQVRIVKLSTRQRAKVGPGVPQVSDVGTVRHVMRDSTQRLNGYIVEHVRPDGKFGWTADFMPDEVGPIE